MKIQRQREAFAYRLAEDVAAAPDDVYDRMRRDGLLKRLEKEFHSWYGEHGDKRLNYAGRGPLGNWRQIENFMKAKYPEAHRGLETGYETARALLDSDEDWKEWDDDEKAWLPGPALYETGPETLSKYKYDPKEIAASMLLLHNRTHPHRSDLEYADQDRLAEIARKRSEMQRKYEQRTAVYGPGVGDLTRPQKMDENGKREFVDNLLHRGPKKPKRLDIPAPTQGTVIKPKRTPEFHTQEAMHRLNEEFHEWADATGAENPYDNPNSAGYHGQERGPIGYWPNIEDFLSEKYPAAHRGIMEGWEDAKPLLDNKYPDHPTDPYQKRYETGPGAVEAYGYDPKEVVATMLLLHNMTHPMREKEYDIDRERLLDIAKKRFIMQRRWEKRQKTAMPVPTKVPSTRNQWEKENLRLKKKRDKAGLGVDLVPNFDDDWDNQVYDQQWDWEGLRGGRSSWYATPLEYEGKGQPGIAYRRKVLNEGSERAIPIDYLIHHDDQGQINGILSHFPEGTPFEKPGSITVTVHPAHREKGIGGTLVQEAEKRFGLNLDEQQFTPLGYEMYRRLKHERGQDVPNIFNERTSGIAERFAEERQIRDDRKGEDLYVNGQIKRLADQFDQWWQDYEPRFAKQHGFLWGDYENQTGDLRGPIGHWPHVETFLKENYPAAHKGFHMGHEQAEPLIEEYSGTKAAPYETGPEAVEKYGYDPKEIAATMLMLHSKTHMGRAQWAEWMQADLDRIYDIYRKRQQMERNRPEMNRIIDEADAMGLLNTTEEKKQRQPVIASTLTADDVLDRIGDEFRDWADENGKTNPYDERRRESGEPVNLKFIRGPIGYWPHIESFLKERYPAAHRGLSYGFEDAMPLLDKEEDLDWLKGKDHYETGPDAEAKYGYDPKEVVSALLLLHNETHHGRQNYEQRDMERLLDIAQKRHKMQRAYEKAQAKYDQDWKVASNPTKLSGELLAQLEREFDHWVSNQSEHHHITNWPSIEGFLLDNYPAAHRGFDMGLEEARPLLRGEPNTLAQDYPGFWQDWVGQKDYDTFDPYETGPEAVAKHGYDPHHVAAGMVYLHNKANGVIQDRDKEIAEDVDFLHGLFKIRTKMQRNHEKRQKQLVNAQKLAGYDASRYVGYPSPNRPKPTDLTVAEVLEGWAGKNKWRGERPVLDGPGVKQKICSDCYGSGWKPQGAGRCPSCEYGMVRIDDNIRRKINPWANKLESALYKEFMDWWHQPGADRPDPEQARSNWSSFPHEPITHWLNVEDFLKERYPRSATGSRFGIEYASPMLEQGVNDQPLTKSQKEEGGYVGTGDVITQAFLNLHNKLQNRNWASGSDKRRYFELMLRHVGPDAVRSTQKAARRKIAFNQDLVDRLNDEFHSWYDKDGLNALAGNDPNMDFVNGNPLIKEVMRMFVEEGRKAEVDGRGPIGYWPNIENFLKAKYPAAHKNFGAGMEQAGPHIDNFDETGLGAPYETGPEAVAQHGYDPAEVAAAFVLLHNKSHPLRGRLEATDRDRLLKIFKVRERMQRQYEDRLNKELVTASIDYDDTPYWADAWDDEDDDENDLPRQKRAAFDRMWYGIHLRRFAAGQTDLGLDQMFDFFNDYIRKKPPHNPATGQPHTPETAIRDWLTGVVPFIQAVYPGVPFERYKYQPHTRGLDDFHDLPSSVAKLIALHTREKYGVTTMYNRLKSDEIQNQAQGMAKDLTNTFTKGYGVNDQGKLVPMSQPKQYPRGEELRRRMMMPRTPQQPADTTPKPMGVPV